MQLIGLIQMEIKMPDSGDSRSKIISGIKTPLAFFSLALLIIEGIIVFLAWKVTGLDRTLLVVGMVVAFVFVIGVVAFLAYKSLERPNTYSLTLKNQSHKYDIFLASPMAAFENDEQYEQNRADILNIIDAFRKECKFKTIFYAGHDITSMKDFEAPDVSIVDNIQALRESNYFVLYYSEKIVSSVLVEAGIALDLRKPSIYFVKDRNHLPFLLRQAEQAFNNIKIYEFKTASDIVSLIKTNRAKLFRN